MTWPDAAAACSLQGQPFPLDSGLNSSPAAQIEKNKTKTGNAGTRPARGGRRQGGAGNAGRRQQPAGAIAVSIKNNSGIRKRAPASRRVSHPAAPPCTCIVAHRHLRTMPVNERQRHSHPACRLLALSHPHSPGNCSSRTACPVAGASDCRLAPLCCLHSSNRLKLTHRVSMCRCLRKSCRHLRATWEPWRAPRSGLMTCIRTRSPARASQAAWVLPAARAPSCESPLPQPAPHSPRAFLPAAPVRGPASADLSKAPPLAHSPEASAHLSDDLLRCQQPSGPGTPASEHSPHHAWRLRPCVCSSLLAGEGHVMLPRATQQRRQRAADCSCEWHAASACKEHVSWVAQAAARTAMLGSCCWNRDCPARRLCLLVFVCC